MKNLNEFRFFQILLLTVLCTLTTACRPIPSTVQSVALDGTPTPPQETPVAAPTEIGSWPLSPDQHLMAAKTHDGAWWMWDSSSRHPVYLLNDTLSHAPPIRHPTFSPDGNYLAAMSMGHVLLWDVLTRKRRMLMLPGAKDYRAMRELVFSPDSHLLAASSCERGSNRAICDEGFVSLWNTSDGTLAHTLPTGFRVAMLQFSADGSTLTVSGCSRTDSTKDSTCYEQSQIVFAVKSGELLDLTRVPQFK